MMTLLLALYPQHTSNEYETSIVETFKKVLENNWEMEHPGGDMEGVRFLQEDRRSIFISMMDFFGGRRREVNMICDGILKGTGSLVKVLTLNIAKHTFERKKLVLSPGQSEDDVRPPCCHITRSIVAPFIEPHDTKFKREMNP